MTRDLRPLVGLLLPEGPPRGAKSDAVRSKAARLVAALARSAHGRAALCREEERREEGTEAGAEAEAFAEAEASDDDALPGALAASLRSTDPAFASLRGTCARLVASLAPRESSTIAAAAGNVVPPSPSFAASLFARGAVPSLCVLLEDPAASEDAREAAAAALARLADAYGVDAAEACARGGALAAIEAALPAADRFATPPDTPPPDEEDNVFAEAFKMTTSSGADDDAGRERERAAAAAAARRRRLPAARRPRRRRAVRRRRTRRR